MLRKANCRVRVGAVSILLLAGFGGLFSGCGDSSQDDPKVVITSVEGDGNAPGEIETAIIVRGGNFVDGDQVEVRDAATGTRKTGGVGATTFVSDTELTLDVTPSEFETGDTKTIVTRDAAVKAIKAVTYLSGPTYVAGPGVEVAAGDVIQTKLNATGGLENTQGTGADELGVAPGGIEASHLGDMGAADGQILTWNDGAASWEASDLGAIAEVDTLQSVVDRDNALTGDMYITGTVTATAFVGNGSALTSIDSASHDHTLAGDVTGATGATVVEGIQGAPVVLGTGPTDGQVLKWVDGAGEWQPQDDNDSATTYTGGDGINVVGTVVSALFGTANTEVARGDHLHDARYVPASDLVDPTGTLNDSGNPVDWSQLKGVPADLEDGDDVGLTAEVDTLQTVTARDGQVLIAAAGANVVDVRNTSNTIGSVAIRGYATGGTAVNYGVYGQSDSSAGYGVYADSANVGLKAGGTNKAAEFVGAVDIAGDVTVTGALTLSNDPPGAAMEAATKKYVDDRDGAHGHTFTGDVTGTVGATVVGGIHSRPIRNTAPNDGNVLKWATDQWVAQADAGLTAESQTLHDVVNLGNTATVNLAGGGAVDVLNTSASGYGVVANSSNVGLRAQGTNKAAELVGKVDITGNLTTTASTGSYPIDAVWTGAGGGFIRLKNDLATDINVVMGANGSNLGIVGTTSNHDLAIFTNNQTRMLVAAGGNVGIGTIAPTQKLDVAGTVNATAFTGNGSGLTNIGNADTVDNVHASDLVRKAGDTMTGMLTVGTADQYSVNVDNNNAGAVATWGVYARADGVNLAGTRFGVQGVATGGGTNYGVYGTAPAASGYAVYANGRLHATGAISTDSTSLVTNLNADTVDGSNASDFVKIAGDTMTGPLTGTISGLNRYGQVRETVASTTEVRARSWWLEGASWHVTTGYVMICAGGNSEGGDGTARITMGAVTVATVTLSGGGDRPWTYIVELGAMTPSYVDVLVAADSAADPVIIRSITLGLH